MWLSRIRTFATPAVKIVMEGTPSGRYAWTLFMTAYQQDKPKEILTDIKYIQQLHDQSEDFRNLLSNPTIHRDKVSSLIKEISVGFQDLTINLLQTLVLNKRTDQLHSICKKYVDYMKVQERKEIVTVVSSEELDQSEKERVAQALDEFGKGTSYTITYKTDPSILGGLQLYFPNAFMDLSLFSRINKIKEDTSALM